jgi:hypothetical protein
MALRVDEAKMRWIYREGDLARLPSSEVDALYAGQCEMRCSWNLGRS